MDTLTRLSHLWRTSVDQSGALLLSLVDFFRAQRLIVRAEAEALETLVYSGQDERLREGYLALQSGDERRCYEAIVEAAAAADSAGESWISSSNESFQFCFDGVLLLSVVLFHPSQAVYPVSLQSSSGWPAARSSMPHRSINKG